MLLKMPVLKAVFVSACASLVLSVVGCATQPVTTQSPAAGVTPAAGVPHPAAKVRAFTISWRENPDFKISLERTMPVFLTSMVQTSYELSGVWHPAAFQQLERGIPESSKVAANAYIGEILGLFRSHSTNLLKDELQTRGIKTGAEMEITVTPLSGFQSIDGWGTNVLFRTEFVEKTSGEKWFVDVMVKSGIHWTGVANASKPTVSFVEQYVENLSKALSKAGAL